MMDIDGGGSISLRELNRVLMGEVVRFVSCAFEHPDSGLLFGLDEENCVIVSEIESDSIARKFPFLVTRMRLFRMNDFKVKLYEAKSLQKVYQELVKLGDDPVELDFVEPLIVINKFSCVLDLEVDGQVFSVTLPVGAFYNMKIFVDKLGELMDDVSPVLNQIDIIFIEKKRQIIFRSEKVKFRLLFKTGPNFRRSCRYALGFSADDLPYSKVHEGQPLLMELHLGLTEKQMEILMVELFQQFDRDGSGEFEFEEFRDFYIKYLDSDESIERLKSYAAHRFRDIEREKFVETQQQIRLNKLRRKQFLKVKEAEVVKNQKEKFLLDSIVDGFGIRRRIFRHRNAEKEKPTITKPPSDGEEDDGTLEEWDENELEEGEERDELEVPGENQKAILEKAEVKQIKPTEITKPVSQVPSVQVEVAPAPATQQQKEEEDAVPNKITILDQAAAPGEEEKPLRKKKKEKKSRIKSSVEPETAVIPAPPSLEESLQNAQEIEERRHVRIQNLKAKRQQRKVKLEAQAERRKKILQQIYQANAELKKQEKSQAIHEEEQAVSSQMKELHHRVKSELINSLKLGKTEFDTIQNLSIDWSRILTSPAVTVTPAIFGQKIKSDAIEVVDMPAAQLHPTTKYYYMLKENHSNVKETCNVEYLHPVYFNADWTRMPTRHSSAALAMISSIKPIRDEAIKYRADRGIKRITAAPPEDDLPSKRIQEEVKRVKFAKAEAFGEAKNLTGLIGRLTVNSIALSALPSFHTIEKNSPYVTLSCGDWKSSTEIYSYAGSTCSWDDLNWIFRLHKTDQFLLQVFSGTTANHLFIGRFSVSGPDILNLEPDGNSIITLKGNLEEGREADDVSGYKKKLLSVSSKNVPNSDEEYEEEEEEGVNIERKSPTKKRKRKPKYVGKFEISIFVEKGQEWDWYIKDYVTNKKHIADVKHQIANLSKTMKKFDVEDFLDFPIYLAVDSILLVDVKSVHWFHKNRLYIIVDAGTNEISTIDDNPLINNVLRDDYSAEWKFLNWNFLITKPDLQLIFKVYSLNIFIGQFNLSGKTILEKTSKTTKEIEFFGEIVNYQQQHQSNGSRNKAVNGKIHIKCNILPETFKERKLLQLDALENSHDDSIVDVASYRKNAKVKGITSNISLPCVVTVQRIELHLLSPTQEPIDAHSLKYIEIFMSCCHIHFGTEVKKLNNPKNPSVNNLSWVFPVTKLMNISLVIAWNRSKKAYANMKSDQFTLLKKVASFNEATNVNEQTFSQKIQLHDDTSFCGYITLHGVVTHERETERVLSLLEEAEHTAFLRAEAEEIIPGNKLDKFSHNPLLEERRKYLEEKTAIPWKDIEFTELLIANKPQQYNNINLIISEIILTDLKNKYFLKKNSPKVDLLTGSAGGSTSMRENAGKEAIWTGLEMTLPIERDSSLRILVQSYRDILGECSFTFDSLFQSLSDPVGTRELSSIITIKGQEGVETGKFRCRYQIVNKLKPKVEESRLELRKDFHMNYPIMIVLFNVSVLNLKQVHRFSKNSPYVKIARTSKRQNDVISTTKLQSAGSYGKWINLFYEVILDNDTAKVYFQVLSDSIVIGTAIASAEQLLHSSPNKLGVSEMDIQLTGVDQVETVGDIRISYTVEPYVDVPDDVSMDEAMNPTAIPPALSTKSSVLNPNNIWVHLDEITIVLNQGISGPTLASFAYGCDLQVICNDHFHGFELLTTPNEFVLQKKEIHQNIHMTAGFPLILHFFEPFKDKKEKSNGMMIGGGKHLARSSISLDRILSSVQTREGKIIVDQDITEDDKLIGLVLISFSLPALIESSVIMDDSVENEDDEDSLGNLLPLTPTRSLSASGTTPRFQPNTFSTATGNTFTTTSSQLRQKTEEVIKYDNPFWVKINKIIINKLIPVSKIGEEKLRGDEEDSDNDFHLIINYDNYEKKLPSSNSAGFNVIEWNDVNYTYFISNSVDKWELSVIFDAFYLGKVTINVLDWLEKCRKSRKVTGIHHTGSGGSVYELFAKVIRDGEMVGKMVIFFTKNKLFHVNNIYSYPDHHFHPASAKRQQLLANYGQEDVEDETDDINNANEDTMHFLGYLQIQFIAVNNLMQIYDLFPNSPKLIFTLGDLEFHSDVAFNAGRDHTWDNLGWGRINFSPNSNFKIVVMSNNEVLGKLEISFQELKEIILTNNFEHGDQVQKKKDQTIIKLERALVDGQVYKGNIEIAFYGDLSLNSVLEEQSKELDIASVSRSIDQSSSRTTSFSYSRSGSGSGGGGSSSVVSEDDSRFSLDDVDDETSSVLSTIFSNDHLSRDQYHRDVENKLYLSNTTPTPAQSQIIFYGISLSELKKMNFIHVNSPQVTISCGNWKQETSRALFAGSKATWLFHQNNNNSYGTENNNMDQWKLNVKGSPFVRITVNSNKQLLGSAHFMVRELLAMPADEIGLIHSVHRLESTDNQFVGFLELCYKIETVKVEVSKEVWEKFDYHSLVENSFLSKEDRAIQKELKKRIDEEELHHDHRIKDNVLPTLENVEGGGDSSSYNTNFLPIQSRSYQFPLMCKVVSIIFENVRRQTWLEKNSLTVFLKNEFTSKSTSLKVKRKGTLVKLEKLNWFYRFMSNENYLELQIVSNGKAISTINIDALELLLKTEKTYQGYLEVVKLISPLNPEKGSCKICMFLSSLQANYNHHSIHSLQNSTIIEEGEEDEDESHSDRINDSKMNPASPLTNSLAQNNTSFHEILSVDPENDPRSMQIIQEKIRFTNNKYMKEVVKKERQNTLLTVVMKLITIQDLSKLFYDCKVSMISTENGKESSPSLLNNSGYLIFDCANKVLPLRMNERTVVKMVVEDKYKKCAGSAIFTVNDFLYTPMDPQTHLAVVYADLTVGTTKTASLSFAFEKLPGNVNVDPFLVAIEEAKAPPRKIVINPDAYQTVVELPNIAQNSNISVISLELSEMKSIHKYGKNSPLISLEYFGQRFLSQCIPDSGDSGLWEDLFWNLKCRNGAILKFKISSRSVSIGIVYIPVQELYSLIPDEFGDVVLRKNIVKDITNENVYTTKYDNYLKSKEIHGKAIITIRHLSWHFKPKLVNPIQQGAVSLVFEPSQDSIHNNNLNQSSVLSATTLQDRILQSNLQQFKKLGIQENLNRFGDSVQSVLSLTNDNPNQSPNDSYLQEGSYSNESYYTQSGSESYSRAREEKGGRGELEEKASFYTSPEFQPDENASYYQSSASGQLESLTQSNPQTNSYSDSQTHSASNPLSSPQPTNSSSSSTFLRPKTSRGDLDSSITPSASMVSSSQEIKSLSYVSKNGANESIYSANKKFTMNLPSITEDSSKKSKGSAKNSANKSANSSKGSASQQSATKSQQLSTAQDSKIEEKVHLESTVTAESSSRSITSKEKHMMQMGLLPKSEKYTAEHSIPHPAFTSSGSLIAETAVVSNGISLDDSLPQATLPTFAIPIAVRNYAFPMEKINHVHAPLSRERIALYTAYTFTKKILSKVISEFVALEEGRDYLDDDEEESNPLKNNNKNQLYSIPFQNLIEPLHRTNRKDRIPFAFAIKYVEQLIQSTATLHIQKKLITEITHTNHLRMQAFQKQQAELDPFLKKRKGILMYSEKKSEVKTANEQYDQLMATEKENAENKTSPYRLERALINGVESFIPQKARLTVLDILGLDISCIDLRVIPTRPYLTVCKPYSNWSAETNPVKIDLSAENLQLHLKDLFILNYFNVSVKFKWEKCILRRGQELIFNLHDARSGLLFAKCVYPYERLYKFPLTGNEEEFETTSYLLFTIANEFGGGQIGGLVRFHIDLTVNEYQFTQRPEEYWKMHRAHHWSIYPLTPITYGIIRQKYHDIAQEYDTQQLVHPSLFGFKIRYRGNPTDESKFIHPIFLNYSLAKKTLFHSSSTDKNNSSTAVAKHNALLKKSKPNPFRWDPADKERGLCIICGRGLTGCPRCFMMPVRNDGSFFYPGEFAYDPEKERKQLMAMEKKLIEIKIQKARQLQKLEYTEQLVKKEVELTEKEKKRNNLEALKKTHQESRKMKGKKSNKQQQQEEEEEQEEESKDDNGSVMTSGIGGGGQSVSTEAELQSLDELRSDVIQTYDRSSTKISKTVATLKSKHSKASRASSSSANDNSSIQTSVTNATSTTATTATSVELEGVTDIAPIPTLDNEDPQLPPFHTNLTTFNAIRAFRINIQPTFNVYIKVMPTGYIKRLTCTSWDTIYQLYHEFYSHSSFGISNQNSMILLPLNQGLLEFHPELAFHTDLQLGDRRGYDTLNDFKLNEPMKSYVLFFINNYKNNNLLKLLEIYFNKNTLYKLQMEKLGIYTGNDKLPAKLTEDNVQKYLVEIISHEYSLQQKDSITYFNNLGSEYKKNFYLKENREKYYQDIQNKFIEKEQQKEELRLKSQMKSLTTAVVQNETILNEKDHQKKLGKLNKKLLQRQLSKKKSQYLLKVDEQEIRNFQQGGSLQQQQQQFDDLHGSKLLSLMNGPPQQQQREGLQEIGEEDNLSISDIILAEETRYQKDRKREEYLRLQRDERMNRAQGGGGAPDDYYYESGAVDHEDLEFEPEKEVDQDIEEIMQEEDLISELDDMELEQNLEQIGDGEAEGQAEARRRTIAVKVPSISTEHSSSYGIISADFHEEGIPFMISSRSQETMSSLNTSVSNQRERYGTGGRGGEGSRGRERREREEERDEDDDRSYYSAPPSYSSQGSYSEQRGEDSSSSYYTAGTGSQYSQYSQDSYSSQRSFIQSIIDSKSYSSATSVTSRLSGDDSSSAQSKESSSALSDWVRSTDSYFTASLNGREEHEDTGDDNSSITTEFHSIDNISLQSYGSAQSGNSLFSGYRRSYHQHPSHPPLHQASHPHHPSQVISNQNSGVVNQSQSQVMMMNSRSGVISSSHPHYIHPNNQSITRASTLTSDRSVYSHQNEVVQKPKRREVGTGSEESSVLSSSSSAGGSSASLLHSKSLTTLEERLEQNRNSQKKKNDDQSSVSTGGLFTYRSHGSSSHPSEVSLNSARSMDSLSSSYIAARDDESTSSYPMSIASSSAAASLITTNNKEPVIEYKSRRKSSSSSVSGFNPYNNMNNNDNDSQASSQALQSLSSSVKNKLQHSITDFSAEIFRRSQIRGTEDDEVDEVENGLAGGGSIHSFPSQNDSLSLSTMELTSKQSSQQPSRHQRLPLDHSSNQNKTNNKSSKNNIITDSSSVSLASGSSRFPSLSPSVNHQLHHSIMEFSQQSSSHRGGGGGDEQQENNSLLFGDEEEGTLQPQQIPEFRSQFPKSVSYHSDESLPSSVHFLGGSRGSAGKMEKKVDESRSLHSSNDRTEEQEGDEGEGEGEMDSLTQNDSQTVHSQITFQSHDSKCR
jgi:hypothetical protein